MTSFEPNFTTHLTSARNILNDLETGDFFNETNVQESLSRISDVRAHLFSASLAIFEDWTKESNNPTAWYLYSSYLLQEGANLEKAFEIALKGMKVLWDEKLTLGALSRHYIRLLKLKNEPTAKIEAELQRIANLVGLNAEQKAYLLGD